MSESNEMESQMLLEKALKNTELKSNLTEYSARQVFILSKLENIPQEAFSSKENSAKLVKFHNDSREYSLNLEELSKQYNIPEPYEIKLEPRGGLYYNGQKIATSSGIAYLLRLLREGYVG